MTEASRLGAADAYCQALARRHYENFWVAARFLPKDLQRHLGRIYAYSRTTDDLGDESGELAKERLAAWRGAVESMLAGSAPDHPVLVALKPTLAEFDIPGRPLLDLIAANEQDQSIGRYRDWRELHAYCLLSAAPVGRMVLRIFRAWSPLAERLSDDVCIGLQLANFAQDVSLDRTKSRSYLLEEELETAGLAAAVELLCRRARLLLQSGRTLEKMVPGRLRVQLALYRLGGEAILDAVREAGFRTDSYRPSVGAVRKVLLLPAALATLFASTQSPLTERRVS